MPELKDMKLPPDEKFHNNIARHIKKVFHYGRRHPNLSVFGVMLIIFAIIFFTSEHFWSYLDIETPEDARRSFVFNYCISSSINSCDIDIYQNFAEIDIDLGYNELQDASGTVCDSYEIRGNIIIMTGCEFSSVINDDTVEISFLNPRSGITFSEDLRLINHYEITTFRSLLAFGEEKVTGQLIFLFEN